MQKRLFSILLALILSGSAPNLSVANAAVSDIEACKLTNLNSISHQRIGWPRDEDTLPSLGKVKILVTALDFDDAPANAFKLSDLPKRMQLGTVNSFYKEVSAGQFEPQFEVYPLIIRMPKNSDKYGDSEETDVVTGGEFATHLIVHDALNQIKSQIDLTQFQGVIAVVTGGHSLSGRVALALSEDYNKPEQVPGDIHNEIVIGDKALEFDGVVPWRMIVHEINHLLGLADLYIYGPDGYWQGKSPGPFGQQGFLRGDSASDSLAYNRWLLGWIPERRVLCLTNLNRAINVRLEPQKIDKGGYELVLIRISENKVIALETPKNKGFQSQTNPNSLLIYSVDSSIEIGQGPIRLIPKLDEISARPLSKDLPDWQRYENAALLRGEMIIFSNLLFANRPVKVPGSYVTLAILAGKDLKTETITCKKGSKKLVFKSYFPNCPKGYSLIR